MMWFKFDFVSIFVLLCLMLIVKYYMHVIIIIQSQLYMYSCFFRNHCLFYLFRVSVPRSSLLSPYRFKPHRRASFDPTDSVGLPSHCLAGWESSKPTIIPMPSSLDLRTSLHQSRTTLVSTCTVASCQHSH